MTKTPEELTEDWKAGKLAAGYYYIKFKNGEIETRDNLIGGFLMNMKNPIIQVIAPVPTYDEYKAMQLRIENEKRLLDYNGKLLNHLKETEKTVKSLFQQIAGANKTIEESTENVDDLKKDLAIQNEDLGKLRMLLKECKNIVAHDCWQEAQFPDGQVVQKQDLLTRINAALGESEER